MPASTPPVLMVLCTCPPDKAADIAASLVQRKLAACVNILSNARSIYRWQGEVQDEQEAVLLMKTSKQRYPELEEALRQMHPYELPEIICFSPEGGLAGYLQWVDESTKPDK